MAHNDLPVVRAMLAIGRGGQLGLHGVMPWEGATGPEFIADVARFFEATRGHVILCGPRTAAAFPEAERCDRTVVAVRSEMAPLDVLRRHAGRIVYIGGGPAVWTSYAPFIGHWDITRLPYDGPADRFFDPAWLSGGPT